MDREDIPQIVAPTRLTDLPDHIIDHILKGMPLRDAVRTSILAKDWKDKWTTIPHLIFDGNFLESLPPIPNVDPELIVDDILAHHRGSILNFTFWDQEVKSMDTLERWLRFLSSHPVEDLHFKTYHCDYEDHMEDVSSLLLCHLVPHYLFGFDCLKCLTLKIVALIPPPEFKGFLKLYDLRLEDVIIDPRDLRSFIAKCPVLESLSIVNSHFERHLDINIDAQSLKSFTFMGQFRSIYIENSKIEEMKVINVEGHYIHVDNYEMPDTPVDESKLVKVFRQLSSVREVVSNNSFLEYLAVGGVPQELAYTLNNLKTIRLIFMDCGRLDIVSCALCLFRSTPNLKTFAISFENWCFYSQKAESPVIEYLRVQQEAKIPMPSLELVKVEGFTGLDPQVEFLKLILLSGTTLKTMEVEVTTTVQAFQSAMGLISAVGESSKAQITIVQA